MPDTDSVASLCEATGGTPLEVGAWLSAALGASRAAWPGVDLGVSDYVAHLVIQAKGGPLDGIHATDLYLATACAAGAPAALAAFETAHRAEMEAVIRRVSGMVDVDEVMQSLRESLFVGGDGAPPKIRAYSGRGELRAWLRVVCTRATLNAATRGPKERPSAEDDRLIDATGGAESAEVVYFRLHYEAEVKRTLPEALASLAQHDRLLLRQHYLDQLTLDQLAGIHAVHVATIKRRLAAAREALTDKLRQLLCERLKLSSSELRSVLAIVQSRLHVTMGRLFSGDSSG